MLRRILGVIIFIIGLLTLVAGIVGAIYSGEVIDSIAVGVDETLILLSDTTANVTETLLVTKNTVADASLTLDTVEQTTDNFATTLSDTQPLVDGISGVITGTAPQNVEAVQDAIPQVAEVAGVVDNTLRTLSTFGFEREIAIPFSQPLVIGFDLGIDYEPEEPFDESLIELGQSLEGLPEQLRGLESDLQQANDNLGMLSQNIGQLSGDLTAINANLQALQPLLDEYIRIVGQAEDALGQARLQVARQLNTIKLGVIAIFAFLALTQLAPLYLGWELMTGQRAPQRETVKASQEMAAAAQETAIAAEEKAVAAQAAAVAAEEQALAAREAVLEGEAQAIAAQEAAMLAEEETPQTPDAAIEEPIADAPAATEPEAPATTGAPDEETPPKED